MGEKEGGYHKKITRL